MSSAPRRRLVMPSEPAGRHEVIGRVRRGRSRGDDGWSGRGWPSRKARTDGAARELFFFFFFFSARRCPPPPGTVNGSGQRSALGNSSTRQAPRALGADDEPAAVALGDARPRSRARGPRRAAAPRGGDRARLTGPGRPGPASMTSTRTRPADHARAHAHGPAAVLDGVGDEVAARLREPQRVGADERAAAQRLDGQRRAERRRERPPRLGGVVEQRADIDELRPRRPRAGRARRRRGRRARAPPAAARGRPPPPRSASSSPCSPSRAAHSGPRSSWPASATSSRVPRQPQRAAPTRAAADAAAPSSSPRRDRAHAATASPARRPAGSRRPTR